MKRYKSRSELPDEEPLQDAVWEDESPAPAPDPERMHPSRQEDPSKQRSWGGSGSNRRRPDYE